MTLYRSLTWLLAVLLALFVAYASSVIANQVKAPIRAYQPGLWHTGTAEANAAYALFAARQAIDPKAVVNARERGLAERAYRSEPLSSAALGLIIASMTEAGDNAARQRLLDLAGQLTRRSSIVTSASIAAAAQADDKKSFFLWLSRGVLTSSKLRSTYISAMADTTAMDGAVEALTPVLGQNPSWADAYWGAVAARPNGLENAATIRIATIGRPWQLVEIGDSDRRLAIRLADAGHFAMASRLAAALEGGARPAAGRPNLLTNGDFSRQPLLPPVDWVLATSGHLGASIDDKAHRMTISAIGGAYGRAVRQLVELSPGEYDFAWSMESNAPVGQNALSARLTCAEAGAKANAIPVVPFTAGSHRGRFLVPDNGCRWYWFSIDARVGDDSSGFDAVVSRLSLSRLTS